MTCMEIEIHRARLSAAVAAVVAALTLLGSVNIASGYTFATEIWCQAEQHPQSPAMAVSPDGTLIATASAETDGSDSSLKIWDSQTGELMQMIPLPAFPRFVAMSLTGYVAVGLSGVNLIGIYDVSNGEHVTTIFRATPAIGDGMTSGTFSPDGTVLAVACASGLGGETHSYTVPEGASVRHLIYPGFEISEPHDVAFSPDGTMLAIGGFNYGWTNKAITVRAFPSGDEIVGFPDFGGVVRCVKFSHDGMMMAETGTDGALRIFDTDTWALLHQFNANVYVPSCDMAWQMDFSPDDSMILWTIGVPNEGDATQRTLILQLDNEEMLAEYWGTDFYNVHFLPDGLRWTRGWDHGLCVYMNEFTTGVDEIAPALWKLSVYPNPFNPTTEVSFAMERDGDARVDVFDVNGRLVRTLVEGMLTAGNHKVSWNGRADNGSRAASGLYFVHLQSGDVVKTVKATLLK